MTVSLNESPYSYSKCYNVSELLLVHNKVAYQGFFLTAVLSLQKQGSGGAVPQPLRDFKYSTESKLGKLLYFMQMAAVVIMHKIIMPLG